MPHVTLVSSLRLEAASGTTLYPGENGFSCVWGELESDDPALIKALDAMVMESAITTLRCGLLEVTGRLQQERTQGDRQYYKVSVVDVRYG